MFFRVKSEKRKVLFLQLDRRQMLVVKAKGLDV